VSRCRPLCVPLTPVPNFIYDDVPAAIYEVRFETPYVNDAAEAEIVANVGWDSVNDPVAKEPLMIVPPVIPYPSIVIPTIDADTAPVMEMFVELLAAVMVSTSATEEEYGIIAYELAKV
jgi:hypothetical protein